VLTITLPEQVNGKHGNARSDIYALGSAPCKTPQRNNSPRLAMPFTNFLFTLYKNFRPIAIQLL